MAHGVKQAMKWQIRTHDEDAILLVTVSGDATVELVGRAVAEGVGAARREGISRFFVDAREVTFAVSDILLYDLPDVVENQELLCTDYVAFVYPVDSSQRETFLFLENLFVNRGFRFRGFTEADDALTWLRASL